MGTYLTEIETNGKVFAGPNIEADSYEEADKIVLEEYGTTYEVVGELEFELDIEL